MYKLILKLRDRAYSKGRRKVSTTAVPSICVGNVTVGGTGKTPHTEFILRTLLDSPQWKDKRIAMLSRGYKRKSKGFLEVSTDSTAQMCGDEPLQIKKGFPQVCVAVDKNRVEASARLAQEGAQIIVLDDAFQYRALKADLNIVLADYSRPVFSDSLLPFGRLRDLPERIFQADIIVITKCPDLFPEQKESYCTEKLGMTAYDPQSMTACSPKGHRIPVLFSMLRYQNPCQVFEETDIRYSYSHNVILVSGIANPRPLRNFLSDGHNVCKTLEFADHRNFSRKDIRKIAAAAKKYPTAGIATTQKDAQRLLDCKYMPESLKKKLFYVPIAVEFLSDAENELFVRKTTFAD